MQGSIKPALIDQVVQITTVVIGTTQQANAVSVDMSRLDRLDGSVVVGIVSTVRYSEQFYNYCTVLTASLSNVNEPTLGPPSVKGESSASLDTKAMCTNGSLASLEDV